MSPLVIAGLVVRKLVFARLGATILAVALGVLSVPARADSDDVGITLSPGAGGETLQLTLRQLAELPQVTVVTENEFSNGLVAYRGPLVRDVVEQLALMQFETLRFVAVNDYYVEIPTEDFRRYDVILATQADGVPLARREKGPLWLMYPISDHQELADPIYIHRLIWQVERIEPS